MNECACVCVCVCVSMCMYVYKKEDPTEGREKNNHHQQTPADWLVWWTHEPFNGPPHPTRAIVRGTPLPTRRNTLHTALIQTRIADKHTRTHTLERKTKPRPPSPAPAKRDLFCATAPSPQKIAFFRPFSLSLALSSTYPLPLLLLAFTVFWCVYLLVNHFLASPLFSTSPL